MFNWEGCPLELFDVYLEVGEVKLLPSPEESTVCMEIWVANAFGTPRVRSECAEIRRRPVYGVLKQVIKLSNGKPVSLVFQCDDAQGDATLLWAGVICQLLRELKKQCRVDSVVFFTGCTAEQVELRAQHKFRRESDRADYVRLWDQVDLLVTGQSNRHTPAKNRIITAQCDALPDRFRWLLNPDT